MNITLNREQIGKLNEIVDHFIEIDKFIIETDNGSGIGTGLSVKFDLFERNDTKIDITDIAGS